jgi:signal transduction histidine kinase
MQMLLDRAKPELKQALDSFREIYPHTVNKVERELREKRLVVDLTFDCMLDMRMMVRDNGSEFDILDPWAQFEDLK